MEKTLFDKLAVMVVQVDVSSPLCIVQIENIRSQMHRDTTKNELRFEQWLYLNTELDTLVEQASLSQLKARKLNFYLDATDW